MPQAGQPMSETPSSDPQTGVFAEQFAALCSEGPKFREFDVVEAYGRDESARALG